MRKKDSNGEAASATLQAQSVSPLLQRTIGELETIDLYADEHQAALDSRLEEGDARYAEVGEIGRGGLAFLAGVLGNIPLIYT